MERVKLFESNDKGKGAGRSHDKRRRFDASLSTFSEQLDDDEEESEGE